MRAKVQHRLILLFFGVLLLSLQVFAEVSSDRDGLANHVVGELAFLADDALRGRGSGTPDELVAAVYVGSQLHEMGVLPAGTQGSYIQDASGEFRFFNGPQQWHTRNVIGIIPGRDRKRKNEVVLLTCHIDHLGEHVSEHGNDIYHGADDDASGCVAVLEIARFLSGQKAPRRTVLFVFFGSEETGGQGNQYFLANPPVPLKSIVANLEFEMIGRPDPLLKRDELWLAGFDRSNLGPLLSRHGAKLVADPHPTENFFQRSDNFALAKNGVIAQTVSSFGLHQDYHRPTDDLDHIDFKHLEDAIKSMLRPIKWLVNSDFRPEWLAGKRP